MQCLTKALYLYAQEHRVVNYLQTREYRQALSGLEEAWESFRGALAPAQAGELDGLLSRQLQASCLEEEATFLAGISIGLELGGL